MLCEPFFLFFPFFLFLCVHFPCIVVFQVVSFGRFRFFWPQTLVDFIFPSLSWSSHWSVCFDSVVKSKIPFRYFTCPALLGERCDSQRHSSLHPSVSLYPTWYLCFHHVFFCFFCASFDAASYLRSFSSVKSSCILSSLHGDRVFFFFLRKVLSFPSFPLEFFPFPCCLLRPTPRLFNCGDFGKGSQGGADCGGDCKEDTRTRDFSDHLTGSCFVSETKSRAATSHL